MRGKKTAKPTAGRATAKKKTMKNGTAKKKMMGGGKVYGKK
jgi:hypothetical protein